MNVDETLKLLPVLDRQLNLTHKRMAHVLALKKNNANKVTLCNEVKALLAELDFNHYLLTETDKALQC